MEKYKKAYKALNYVFFIYMACLVIPFLKIELSGSEATLWLSLLLVSQLAYLYFLGVLILGTNRNYVKWVGLTAVGFPFSIAVSYILLKPVAIEQGWN